MTDITNATAYIGTVMTDHRRQQGPFGRPPPPCIRTLRLVPSVPKRGHQSREEVGDGSGAGDEVVQKEEALNTISVGSPKTCERHTYPSAQILHRSQEGLLVRQDDLLFGANVAGRYADEG
jgi:hypothetical protein